VLHSRDTECVTILGCIAALSIRWIHCQIAHELKRLSHPQGRLLSAQTFSHPSRAKSYCNDFRCYPIILSVICAALRFYLSSPAEKHGTQRQTHIAVIHAIPTQKSPSFATYKVLMFPTSCIHCSFPAFAQLQLQYTHFCTKSIGYLIGIDEHTFSSPKKLTSI